MTPAQLQQVRRSFDLIEAQSDQVAEKFYENLFDLAPELRKQFSSVDMETQGNMVLQAVGIAVNGLEDLEALRSPLASLGYRHIVYGVKQEYFEVAVEALIAAFRDSLGGRFSRDIEDLWRPTLTSVATLMTEGGLAIRKSRRGASLEFRGVAEPGGTQDAYLARFMPEGAEAETEAHAEPVVGSVPKAFTVEFVGDKTAEAGPLQSILDISLGAGIGHAFECGGRGKCTTCRVVIVEGLENCLPRNQPEARMARAKGFPADLRLACQTRIVGPARIKRLVHDSADIDEALSGGRSVAGREMSLAVLFADIRGFTTFSEKNLPYDTVHALNRYFNAVGETLDEHSGYIDKYMGDGIMALFGLNPNRSEHPCVDAVAAAVAMLSRLREVNAYMSDHLAQKFEIGIGIHYGTVVVGEVGFRLKRQFTAIGDTVNIAARLESETKNHATSILVSEHVRSALPAGQFQFGKSVEVALRGKSRRQLAHEVLTPPEQGAESC